MILKTTKDFSTKLGKIQWSSEFNMNFLIKVVLIQSSIGQTGLHKPTEKLASLLKLTYFGTSHWNLECLN